MDIMRKSNPEHTIVLCRDAAQQIVAAVDWVACNKAPDRDRANRLLEASALVEQARMILAILVNEDRDARQSAAARVQRRIDSLK